MQQLGLSSRNTPKEESRARALLWPDIRTSPGINSVIDSGRFAAFAVAGITVLAVLLRWVPVASLIDAVFFTANGYGIGRKSRICAMLGLVLYVVSQVFAYWNSLGGWNIV